MVVLTAKIWIEEYFRQREVARRFWRDSDFRAIDSDLRRAYRFKNPYAISRRFTKKHVYGETPLQLLEKIALKVGLKPDDHLFELGAGRHRSAFFLSHFFKCQVSSFEIIPAFNKIAQEVVKKHEVDRVTIREEDFFEADYSGASVVYLYGTCMTEDEVDRISEKLQSVPSGTKIISVSFPLNGFEVIKSFIGHFPWGEGEIFIQWQK